MLSVGTFYDACVPVQPSICEDLEMIVGDSYTWRGKGAKIVIFPLSASKTRQ